MRRNLVVSLPLKVVQLLHIVALDCFVSLETVADLDVRLLVTFTAAQL